WTIEFRLAQTIKHLNRTLTHRFRQLEIFILREEVLRIVARRRLLRMALSKALRQCRHSARLGSFGEPSFGSDQMTYLPCDMVRARRRTLQHFFRRDV